MPMASTAEVDCVDRRVDTVEDDVEELSQSFVTVKQRVARVESDITEARKQADRQYRHVSGRVDRVENDVGKMGRRFDVFEDSTRQMNRQMNQRFDRVEGRVQTLQEQQQSFLEKQQETISKLIDVMKTPRIQIGDVHITMTGNGRTDRGAIRTFVNNVWRRLTSTLFRGHQFEDELQAIGYSV